MQYLTGTYDQGMRLRLSLHPDAFGPLRVGVDIPGRAERVYRKYLLLHLQAWKRDGIAIQPYPTVQMVYRFNISLSVPLIEELKEKGIIAATPPLSTGVTHFELKLEEIVAKSRGKHTLGREVL